MMSIGPGGMTEFRTPVPPSRVYPWPGYAVAVRASVCPPLLVAGVVAVGLLVAGETVLTASGIAVPAPMALAGDLAPAVAETVRAPIAVIWHSVQVVFAREAWSETAGLGLALLWSTFVCGFFGAVVCRRVVLHHSSGTAPPLGDVARFAVRRLGHVVVAPLIAIFGLSALWLAGRAFSLVGAMPWVGSALVPVVNAIEVALWCIGAAGVILAAFAWPLMIASQCAEDLDALDGFSRAINFVLTRPVLYLCELCAGCVVTGLVSIPLAVLLAPVAERVPAVWLVPGGIATTAFFAWAALCFLRLRQRIDAIETDDLPIPVDVRDQDAIPLAGRAAYPVEDAAA